MNKPAEKNNFKDNKTILSFLSKDISMVVCIHTIDIVTSTKQKNSKVSLSVLIDSSMHESDGSIIFRIMLYRVYLPLQKIPIFDIDILAPACIEKIE